MKKFFVIFFMFFILLPLTLFAADAQAGTWGDVFVTLFNNWVVPIVGTALGLILLYLVKLIASKFGVTLSKEQEAWIADNAQKLVLSAEEVARTAIKNQGDKITGGDKLRQVVGALMEKFPKLTEDEAKKYANAAVASIPGIGNFQIGEVKK